MHIVNASTMRALDQQTIQELGLPSMVLMERAALGIVAAIYQHLAAFLQEVHILVGTGNNGGDGLAIGRLLHQKGVSVKLWLWNSQAERSPDNQLQLDICQRLGLDISEMNLDSIASEWTSATVIIDSLFGVGLNRELSPELCRAIESANQSTAKRVAVDISSGLHSDTGQVLGAAFQADLTVSCALPKWGHLLDPALKYVGHLEIVDIGIPSEYYGHLKEQVLSPSLLHALKPLPRESNSHKGSYGSLGIVAGSLGMSGAARMAAEAALETGVGLVYLLVPASIQDQLAASLPQVQVVPLPEYGGQLAPQALDILRYRLSKMDAVLIGPGLGREEPVGQLLLDLLPLLKQPLVLDADALWFLAQDPRQFEQLTVLTPHPGELANLLNQSKTAIQSDRVSAAKTAAQTFQAVTLLKGARSLIAEPNGYVWFNSTGNPGMARGGMGDVLAGLVAGLLAQGQSAIQSACLATYWHGLAGDLVKQEVSEISLTVARLQAALPQAWMKI